MRPFRLILAVALLVFIAGTTVAQDRPRVVAVNYPLQYIAERLLGDSTEVIFPVPSDVDPSFWRPSIADISMIQEANLILLNGAGFASWIDRVSLPRSRLVNSSAAIEDQFIVTESITHSHGDGGEHSHEGLASYTWLDPMLAIAQAEAVANAITAKGLAADVAGPLDALRADFQALDAAASESLADLGDITLIATHPRYHYFARRYGLTITSLEWEAGAMPSDAQITELKSVMDESGATLLLWEAEPPQAAIDAVAAIGMDSVTFPPLAHAVAHQTYTEAFAQAIAAIADAAQQTTSN